MARSEITEAEVFEAIETLLVSELKITVVSRERAKKSFSKVFAKVWQHFPARKLIFGG